MKQILTPEQIADLMGIQRICDEIQTDLVLIGAMALVILFGDLQRFTRDLDLTVALDLNDLGAATLGRRPSTHRFSWLGKIVLSSAMA